MAATHTPLVALEPGGNRSWLADAIRSAGGELVPAAQAEVLVWAHPSKPTDLAEILAANPGIRWVQLPWAGIEPFLDLVAAEGHRIWTCAKGVYADPVAEHALALLLAGLRHLGPYTRTQTWTTPAGRNLLDGKVTIVGGGGIGQVLLDLLAPFRVEVTVVRRNPAALAGAARVVGPDQLHDALPGADGVILALPLLPETRGLFGAAEFALMEPHAWLVNVARGAHVVTDDLVVALRDGVIGGAALDVTDPEPLPDGHPLWSLPNCIITPHTGNTPEMAMPLLTARVKDNISRWARGDDLVGLVDTQAGY